MVEQGCTTGVNHKEVRVQKRLMFLFAALAVLLVSMTACETPVTSLQEDEPRDTTPTPSPVVVFSVEISAVAGWVHVGKTLNLTAVAKDIHNNVIPGRSFNWSVSSSEMASITAAGELTGKSVGSVVVTAEESSSKRRGSASVLINAPPRPSGSILGITVDSVLGAGSYYSVSALFVTDTSASGKDYKVGKFREMRDDGAVLRYYRMASITECPNGDVYALSTNELNSSAILWLVDPKTAQMTKFIWDLNYIRSSAEPIACHPSGYLLAVDNFAGIASTYKIDLQSKKITSISSVMTGGGYYYGVLGLAISPSGVAYSTVFDAFSTARPEPQWLVTVSLTSGQATQVGSNQPARFPRVSLISFSGNRLFGITAGVLVEFNLQTGELTAIRQIKMQ